MNGQIQTSIPHDLYEDIEARLMPMIRRKAARLRGRMDMDDAIQEARLVLFRVLHSYDFNRQPNLERYVGVCLNNAFAGQYHKDNAQRRMPRLHRRNGAGGWSSHPVLPSPLDGRDAPDDTLNPEMEVILGESRGLVNQLFDHLAARLPARDRVVMEALRAPPEEIALSPGDSGFNQALAAYLGVTKNMLDWSLSRIRLLMLEEMRDSNFELGRVNGPDWPYLVHSARWDDQDVIKTAISERQLDPVVCDTEVRMAGKAEMSSQAYGWGEVLCLKMGEVSATLVLQGRFNRLSGTLHGTKYGSQLVPLPWYQACMKMLNNGTTT